MKLFCSVCSKFARYVDISVLSGEDVYCSPSGQCAKSRALKFPVSDAHSIGASKSIKTDPAAEALQELEHMCVSSLSPKNQRAAQSAAQRALCLEWHLFRVLNKRRQESDLAKEPGNGTS